MRQYAGLEIASTGVRVAEIFKKPDQGGFITLKRAAIEPFPVDNSPVSMGRITDRTMVAHTIREALAKAGMARRGLVVGVTADALSAYLEVPPGAKDHEREYMIRHADLPIWDILDKETARLSWRVVDKFVDGEGRNREVLGIAAVATESIETLEDTLDLAQVRPAAIDLSGAALIRALVRVPEDDRTVQTIIDIGAAQTLVVTRVGSHPRDIRTVPIGGQAVTDTVAKVMKLPPPQAEEHKRHMEIPRTEGLHGPMGSLSGLSIRDNKPLSEVEEALTIVTDDLVSAIAELVDQDTALHPSAPTQGALLVGGGSRLRGMRERMAARLGVPVHLGQPWVSDKFNKETRFLEGNRRLLADLSVAIGLAMWGLVPHPSTDMN